MNETRRQRSEESWQPSETFAKTHRPTGNAKPTQEPVDIGGDSIVQPSKPAAGVDQSQGTDPK